MSALPSEHEILAEAERFIRASTVTDEQALILELPLAEARARLDAGDVASAQFGYLRLPLLVYAAVRGDSRPALPLAVVALLLRAGVDLLDDVMDGDLPDAWRARPPAEPVLAAATLLCALPLQALCALDAPPATVVALQRTLARSGLVMSAGQQRDVLLTGSRCVSVEAVERAVAGKSGEAVALLARLAAQLAGAASGRVERFAAMGQALGMAGQIRSDCADLFGPSASKDLAQGARTLPIALHLQALTDDERDPFLALLEAARTDPAAHDAIRTRLATAGILRECAVMIELYCDRARTALVEAGAGEPAASALRRLIDTCSFFAGRPAEEKGRERDHVLI
jgi:geranylgeranyl pyrophosphate synthase